VDPNDVAATVRRAAAGDRTAWDALVGNFSHMLWGVASGYRLGRADTAEVVQTTWLRLVEHLDRIKQPEALGGWLATTARHEALRMLRLRGREVSTDDDAQLDREPSRQPQTGPEERALTADRNRRLWSAFERLPANCRLLLRLLVVDAPPYAQVAEALSMPIGSIGPTRARCLVRLRRLLDEGSR
jgi:RNA polymerase sigma factor (sigma-70 family)